MEQEEPKDGDIVVCIHPHYSVTKEGSIYILAGIKNVEATSIGGEFNGVLLQHLRKATPREITAYYKGITNIRDMSLIKDEIINSYEIY